MADHDRIAYTVNEAAEAIGVGRSTLYQEIAAGRLTTVKVGRRRLITRSALEEYLQAQTVRPAA